MIMKERKDIMTNGVTTTSANYAWIIVAVSGLFCLLFLAGLARTIRKNYFGKAVTVKARVADKLTDTYHPASRFSPGTVTDYFLVFDAGGKILRFKVSFWVYDTVKKGEKGLLRYQGDRFIRFK
jgi:Protein of unknown function (DUF2500).